jgi:hypothetical protein
MSWEELLERSKEIEARSTAERIRFLAAVQQQLTSEIVDVLQIAADGVEGEQEETEK